MLSLWAFLFPKNLEIMIFDVFKAELWSYVLKNLDIGSFLQKISSLSCKFLSQRSAKNLYIIPFLPANFVRMCVNLLVSGLLVGRKCLIMKTLKNQTFDTYWPPLLYTSICHLLKPWQAPFLCEKSDYFWDSAEFLKFERISQPVWEQCVGDMFGASSTLYPVQYYIFCPLNTV